MPDEKDKDRPGPKPDRVKIDSDWEDAVRRALDKRRPDGGWPKHGDGGDTKQQKETPHD